MKAYEKFFRASSVRALLTVGLLVGVSGSFFKVKSDDRQAQVNVAYPKVQLFQTEPPYEVTGWERETWQPPRGQRQLESWLELGDPTVFALPNRDGMGFSEEFPLESRPLKEVKVDDYLIPNLDVATLESGRLIEFGSAHFEQAIYQGYELLVDALPSLPDYTPKFPEKVFWTYRGGIINDFLPEFTSSELALVKVDSRPHSTEISFELLSSLRPRVRVTSSCGNSGLDMLACRKLSGFLYMARGNPALQSKIERLQDSKSRRRGRVIVQWRYHDWGEGR